MATQVLITSNDVASSCVANGFPADFTGQIVYTQTLTNRTVTGNTLKSNTCVPPATPPPVVGPVITTNNIVSSCQANGYGPGYTGQIVYAEQMTNGVRTSYTGVSNTCTAPPPFTGFPLPTPNVSVTVPVITTRDTTRNCSASDFPNTVDADGVEHDPFANRSTYHLSGWITTRYTTTNGVTDQGMVLTSFPESYPCKIINFGMGAGG